MPAMSAMQRVAATLVVILVLVAVGVLALAAAGAPVGRGPGGSADPSGSSDATASADPTAAPSETDTPAPTDEAALLAALAEIEAQVVAIRGLPAADIGPPEILGRDELVEELERLFAEDYPLEERERDNLVLRAFGLLGPDDDVAELQLALLGDQVLGFYDDVERRMVVVTDTGLDANARLTYAHEYAHALQDAAFGLDSLEVDAEGADDRALARTTLIEGDATVVMLAWAFAHLTPAELMEIGTGTPLPDVSDVPTWMLNQLQFPYLVGQVWIGSLAGSPIEPDFAAVDAAWSDPPDTTEQVMEPGAWNPREPAVDVAAPGIVAALGDGWEEVETTTVGQGTIEIMLDHFGVAAPEAATAARGWGGDRVVVATGPDGTFALGWRLAWDTEADAAEFFDTYGSIVQDLPFPASVTRLANGDILVAHASSPDLLAQVVDAAD
jgi:hypothetical protein